MRDAIDPFVGAVATSDRLRQHGVLQVRSRTTATRGLLQASGGDPVPAPTVRNLLTTFWSSPSIGGRRPDTTA